MELNKEINEKLWENIKKDYDSEDYTTAALNSMYFIEEVLRKKTGLKGNYRNLVEKSLGGSNPKIKVNKLFTNSDKNIQRALKEILKGVYIVATEINNKGNISLTKKEGDAAINFINCLLDVIDKSQLSFNENQFLERVFDIYFVPAKEYADLLVLEIPNKKRADIAISVLLKRTKGDLYNLSYFMKSLFESLDDEEIDRVYKVISEQLKYTSDKTDIRTIIYICPGRLWGRVDKCVKMRIENILLEDVKGGRYNKNAKRCIADAGALGSWIDEEYLKNFEDIDKWKNTLINKLKSGNMEEIDYVEAFFKKNSLQLNEEEIDINLKKCISEELKEELAEKCQEPSLEK